MDLSKVIITLVLLFMSSCLTPSILNTFDSSFSKRISSPTSKLNVLFTGGNLVKLGSVLKGKFLLDDGK